MTSFLGISGQDWHVYIICAGIAFGGVFMGLDGGLLGVINSGTHYAEYFNMSAAVLGFTNSFSSVANFLGNLIAPFFIRRFGRRWSLIVGAVLLIASNIFAMESVDLAMLIVGRLIGGPGNALVCTSIPMYIAEVAPPKLRGRLMSWGQTYYQIGNFFGFLVG